MGMCIYRCMCMYNFMGMLLHVYMPTYILLLLIYLLSAFHLPSQPAVCKQTCILIPRVLCSSPRKQIPRIERFFKCAITRKIFPMSSTYCHPQTNLSIIIPSVRNRIKKEQTRQLRTVLLSRGTIQEPPSYIARTRKFPHCKTQVKPSERMSSFRDAVRGWIWL